MEDFAVYGYVSNLKINYSKSEALNVSLPDRLLSQVKESSPFRWELKALKYLKDMFGHNFPVFLKNVREDLLRWQSGHFSWFGRAAIIKMIILPRLLYLLHALPIRIPASFFSALKSIILKFLWNSQTPRVRFSRLMKPKEPGSMGIPDFRAYYQATHLTRIVDWHCHSVAKEWVSLGYALFPIPLKFSPWIPWGSCPTSLKRHPLLVPHTN